MKFSLTTSLGILLKQLLPYQMAKEAWYLVPNVAEDCGQNIFTSKRYQVWYLQNIDAQQNSRVHYEIWGYQSKGLIADSLDI